MYPVTNDYIQEILEDDRVTDIYGTIKLVNGNIIYLTKGSFDKAPTITNQCTSDNEIVLGGVYQGQLVFTFYTDIDRYLMYGAKVILTFSLRVNGSPETVPCGEYYVTECVRAGLGKLKLTCLDIMDALDAKYDGATVSGTAYDILNLISVKTGVPLGQTESDISTLPNGSRIFGIPMKSSIQTYRDMLRDLSACLAGFGTIGRDGKLYICSYAMTAQRTITADHRGNDSISDFIISYSSVSCNKKGKDFIVGTGEKQNIDLGDNAFLQQGLDETTEAVLQTILSVFEDLEYVPAQLSLLKSDPSFDLGDMVEATGYTAGTSILVPVHKYTWTWGGGQKLEGVGKEPSVTELKSRETKRLESKMDQMEALENTVLPLQNISKVSFSEDWALITTAKILLYNDNTLLFHAAVRITMSEKGVVKFRYSLNGVYDDFIHECQVPEGVHTITLFLYFDGSSTSRTEFKVYISGSSDGFIEPLGFRGAITGPGMIEGKWDGTIELADEWSVLPIIQTVTDIETHSLDVRLLAPRPKATLADVLVDVSGAQTMQGLTEGYMQLSMFAPKFYFVTESGDSFITEQLIDSEKGYLMNENEEE